MLTFTEWLETNHPKEAWYHQALHGVANVADYLNQKLGIINTIFIAALGGVGGAYYGANVDSSLLHLLHSAASKAIQGVIVGGGFGIATHSFIDYVIDKIKQLAKEEGNKLTPEKVRSTVMNAAREFKPSYE